jgi:hypothetical protein
MSPITRTRGKKDAKTKKIETLQDRIAQKQAFKDLLALRRATGGRKKNDIQMVSDDYKKRGFKKVTVRNLRYRVSEMKKKGRVTLPSEIDPPPKKLYGQPGEATINVSTLTNNTDSTDDDSGDDDAILAEFGENNNNCKKVSKKTKKERQLQFTHKN